MIVDQINNNTQVQYLVRFLIFFSKENDNYMYYLVINYIIIIIIIIIIVILFHRVHMPSVTYLRLDGSVPANSRHDLVQR